jgi:hypothetical protein
MVLNVSPRLQAAAAVHLRSEKRTISVDAAKVKGLVGVFTSAAPRCFDGGDVDLLHRHHRLEGTFCLTATCRKRIG